MRGLEIETRNGARSSRAGPVRFKVVPRIPDSQDNRIPTRNKPKSRQQPQRPSRSKNRSPRKQPTRRNHSRDRIDIHQRKRQALDDVATYRVVSVRDLVDQRFGGNAFAARKGIDALKKEGFLLEHTARLKNNKTFKVLYATENGRRKAWGNRENKDQRYWGGLVKPAEIRHDSAVYRAARSEIAKLNKSGSRVKRIHLDYELKSQVTKASERARSKDGNKAAADARIETARQMNLHVDSDDKIHYPDARIEYESEQGSPGRVDVEVTSDSYRSSSIQSKLSAGFKLYANSSSAQRRISSALGIKDSKNGRSGGGANRDEELFEL